MTMLTQKPLKPYTVFNVFFFLERELILQSKVGGEKFSTSSTPRPEDADASPRPSRYSSLVLPEKWYIPPKEKKDINVHGMTRLELNQHVFNRWTAADKATKQYCTSMAMKGRAAYRLMMQAYNKTNRKGGMLSKMISRQTRKPTSSQMTLTNLLSSTNVGSSLTTMNFPPLSEKKHQDPSVSSSPMTLSELWTSTNASSLTIKKFQPMSENRYEAPLVPAHPDPVESSTAHQTGFLSACVPQHTQETTAFTSDKSSSHDEGSLACTGNDPLLLDVKDEEIFAIWNHLSSQEQRENMKPSSASIPTLQQFMHGQTALRLPRL